MEVPQAHVVRARERREGLSLTSLILVAGVTLVIVAFIIVITAPFTALLSTSSYTPVAAFHGLVATVMFVVTPIGLYLGYQLFQGQLANLRTLKLLSVVTATISFITIVFGNWTLIGYRVKDGAREWLQANNPAVHGTFFEFKEYLALFTLPLAVLAAYLLYRYADSLEENRLLRGTIAVILALTFLYFAVTFALGASIARVRAV
jgi:hypothetical protein